MDVEVLRDDLRPALERDRQCLVGVDLDRIDAGLAYSVDGSRLPCSGRSDGERQLFRPDFRICVLRGGGGQSRFVRVVVLDLPEITIDIVLGEGLVGRHAFADRSLDLGVAFGLRRGLFGRGRALCLARIAFSHPVVAYL